jgi:hypothetical protein
MADEKRETARKNDVDESELVQDLEIKDGEDAETVRGGATTDGGDAAWNWWKK